MTIGSKPTIDLAILTRDQRPLSPTIARSIQQQRAVSLRVHRVIGTPQGDEHRVATIARARNEAIELSKSPWLMFLDDDVAMAPDCVARLHHALVARPNFAAFGADYLGEARRGSSPHVSMGATLFRRSALNATPFRWEPQKCECLCCCEDVRARGSRIEYLPSARAWHLSKSRIFCDQSRIQAELRQQAAASASDPKLSAEAKVLAAFNRRDFRRFREAFVPSLRDAGNQCEVIAVGYGLYPTELRLLSKMPGVHVINQRVNGQMPPVRRLTDFGMVLQHLPSETPVAYWDTSDVIFQGDLNPLWQLTKEYSDKILAVREPLGFPHNQAIFGWSRTIANPASRRQVFQMLSQNPFLNSGFAAGTAKSLKAYFDHAPELRRTILRGTSDWGDQTALNVYCHQDPDRWQEIPEGWNYCVHDRPRREVYVQPDGRVVSRSGVPIHVVHGNARSMRKLAIR